MVWVYLGRLLNFIGSISDRFEGELGEDSEERRFEEEGQNGLVEGKIAAANRNNLGQTLHKNHPGKRERMQLHPARDKIVPWRQIWNIIGGKMNWGNYIQLKLIQKSSNGDGDSLNFGIWAPIETYLLTHIDTIFGWLAL